MKSTLIIKRLVQVVLLGAALASPVMAQMGPGAGGNYGGGWGGDPSMQGGGMGPGGGRGMHGMRRGGMGGMGGMGGGMMANQNAVRGVQLMTPEERTAQQVKMRAVKTYDECKVVQTTHRTVIETRAKEKGLNLMSPRGNPCDKLKARGLIS
jgi:hypothetical protein